MRSFSTHKFIVMTNGATRRFAIGCSIALALAFVAQGCDSETIQKGRAARTPPPSTRAARSTLEGGNHRGSGVARGIVDQTSQGHGGAGEEGFCGDGDCNGDETIQTCPQDCCVPQPLDPIIRGVNARTGEQDHFLRLNFDVLHVDCPTRGSVDQNPLCEVTVGLAYIDPIPDTANYCLRSGRRGDVFQPAPDETGDYVKAAGVDDLRIKFVDNAPVLSSFASGNTFQAHYVPYTNPFDATGWEITAVNGLHPDGSPNMDFTNIYTWAPVGNNGDPHALTDHQTSETKLRNIVHRAGGMSFTFEGDPPEEWDISQNAANGLQVVRAVVGGPTYTSYIDVRSEVNGKAYTFSATTREGFALFPDVPAGTGSYVGTYAEPIVAALAGPPELVSESEPDITEVNLDGTPGVIISKRNDITLETRSFDSFGRLTDATQQGGMSDSFTYDDESRVRLVRSTKGEVTTEVAYEYDPENGALKTTTETSSLSPPVVTETIYSGDSNGVPLRTEKRVGGVRAWRVVPTFELNSVTSYPVLTHWTEKTYNTDIGTVTRSFTIRTTESQFSVESDINPEYISTYGTDALGRFTTFRKASPFGIASSIINQFGPAGDVKETTSTVSPVGGPQLTSGGTFNRLADGINWDSFGPGGSSSSGTVTTNGINTRTVVRNAVLGITNTVDSTATDPQNSTTTTTTSGSNLSASLHEVCRVDPTGQWRCDADGATSENDPVNMSYFGNGY